MTKGIRQEWQTKLLHVVVDVEELVQRALRRQGRQQRVVQPCSAAHNFWVTRGVHQVPLEGASQVTLLNVPVNERLAIALQPEITHNNTIYTMLISEQNTVKSEENLQQTTPMHIERYYTYGATH